jgi:hypothetical protein
MRDRIRACRTVSGLDDGRKNLSLFPISQRHVINPVSSAVGADNLAGAPVPALPPPPVQ